MTVLAQVGGLTPNSAHARRRVKGPTANLLLSGNSMGLNVEEQLLNTKSNNAFFSLKFIHIKI